jgi:aspartyl/asparaginyl-tRNA synthetase
VTDVTVSTSRNHRPARAFAVALHPSAAGVTHLRSSGKVAFVVMRDGTGTLQAVVVKSAVAPEVWERFAQPDQETSIEITGEVRVDARAPGGVEIGVSHLVILGTSPIDYPIQPKEHGIDFLMDHRHFWLRSPRQQAILRVRHEIEQAIQDFFLRARVHSRRYADSHRRPSVSERLVSTEYFDEGQAYLAQTGQLYGEARPAALGASTLRTDVPRRENRRRRRHLTEFWMIEPEVAFNDSERQHATSGGLRSLSSFAAVSTDGSRSLRSSSAIHPSSRGRAAVRCDWITRTPSRHPAKRQRDEMGEDLGRG